MLTVVFLEVVGVATIAAAGGAAREAALIAQASVGLFLLVSLASMIVGWILTIVLLAADVATVPEFTDPLKVPSGA